MKKLNFKVLLGLAFMSFGVVSCGYVDDVEGYTDEEWNEVQTKLAYTQAFEKAFGKIDPKQDWDLSTGLYNVAEATTRAEGEITVTTANEWYEVQSGSVTWLKNTLDEGDKVAPKNKTLGEPFALKSSGYPFQIIPIYQGQASMVWDLHLVILDWDGQGNQKDIKLWSKGENLQMKSGTNRTYTNVGTGGNTTNATAVQSKPITIDGVPSGKNMYLYLDITTGSSSYADKGTKQYSIEVKKTDGTMKPHMMLNLDMGDSKPSNLGSTTIIVNGKEEQVANEVFVVGCEDADKSGSDWDYNDVVFLFVGKPFAPGEVTVTGNEYDDILVEKRYMVEDLGTTDDFDFNDIVVDFQKYQHVTLTYTNGVLTGEDRGPEKQRAVIRHLGGTLEWNLFVKSERDGEADYDVTGVRSGIKDFDPNEIKEFTDNNGNSITPWNPSTNNIYFKIQQKNTSNGVAPGTNTAAFPGTGEVPLIIATDKNKAWMGERVKINWGPFKQTAEE